jgi:tellurite resistance protein TerC
MAWIVLFGLFVMLLAFDMLVLHKKNEKVSHKKAAIETAFWVSFALLFSIAVYYFYEKDMVIKHFPISGAEAVTKYITGYLIELSLSVDNLFVIAMIFTAQKIPMKFQHRVLYWGIIGAIVMRGIMITLGITLIERFSWMTYVFGAFLLYTAFNMLKHEEEGEKNPSRFISRFIKVTPEIHGQKFWIKQNGHRLFTPLFLALIMVELADVIFAVDSIPAILAVTTEPYIVFSSNIFAILGLRSMYFFLANMLEKFHYLKYSVFAILVFVAMKLMVSHHYKLPEWFSLSFIALSLVLGVVVSLNKVTPDDLKD